MGALMLKPKVTIQEVLSIDDLTVSLHYQYLACGLFFWNHELILTL